MGIKLLPKEVYMKIAAGEVVTNPAAVVKELIENSIDAGAGNIYLEIKSGGNESILVRDDGSGITEEEMYVAVLPHSTSKIEKWEDLLNLNSFGFRGEALASICAVTHMYFSSRNSESEFGTRMFFQGGQFMEKKSISMNIGTEIEIRNIFYNVPARRKFLKSPSSEGRRVIDITDRFMLSNPGVGFKIMKDDKLLYDLKPETFGERICRIFQNVRSEELAGFDEIENGIRIHGFAFPPNITRPNRSGIITFVNNRYVKDMMLYSAVTSAYARTVENGRYPLSVLMIEVPSDTVDVNIHPQKLEVKFSESEKIHSSIVKCLKKALGNNTMRISFKETGDFFPSGKSDSLSNRIKTDSQYDSFKVAASISPDKYSGNDLYHDETGNPKEIKEEISENEYRYSSEYNFGRHISEAAGEAFHTVKEDQKSDGSFKFLCIAGKRYIVGEKEDALLIIDFHAAHEAVIFKELKITRSVSSSQKLLIPIEFKVDVSFAETARIRKKRINILGFDFKISGDRILIDKIPGFQRMSSAEDTFREIVEELRNLEIEEETLVFDRIFSTMACRSAYKTGDMISQREAENLVEKMEEYGVSSCPHGRPVKFLFSFSELDTYFKRN